MAKKKGTQSGPIQSGPSRSGPAQSNSAQRPHQVIRLRGARQHNLKGLDLDFPLHQLSVICGVSGSGKSSLAFETLYAEGQRRYIESFSAYSRQFLERIEKPKFDLLEPLPPSVAVTRDVRIRNNRSTVGTATEILEYLRMVFAQRADLFCHKCGQPVRSYKPHQILQSLAEQSETRCMVGFRMQWASSEELAMSLADLQSMGFVRMVVGETLVNLGDSEREAMASLFRNVRESFVIVDRLKWTGTADDRWSQSITAAFDQCLLHDPFQVALLLESANGEKQVEGTRFDLRLYATSYRCKACDIEFVEPDASLFNFNHPRGACVQCEGFGEVSSIDKQKVVPDTSLSLRDGAIAPWRTPSYAHELDELLALAKEYRLPVDVPVSDLTPSQWSLVEQGVPKKKFGGLNGFFAWLERHKYKMHVRMFLARWRSYDPCPTCGGRRLTQDSLAYRWQGLTFADVCKLPVRELIDRLETSPTYSVTKDTNEQELSANRLFLAGESHAQYNVTEPFRQLVSRLQYLESIGLGYVGLDRPMHTLSTGEAQRVNLTSLLGSSLVDMLYVFDEPTVGLHPADVKKVVQAIQAIRDRGNTVILVEHEPAVIEVADRVIEIGPKAGTHGGQVVFDGTPQELLQSSSLIGKHLRGESYHRHRHADAKDWIHLKGASGRNLKNVSISIPIGRMTAVTGPSGAGKSSLVLETLAPAIGKHFGEKDHHPLQFESMAGSEALTGILSLDHSPIPRSSRSTPGTYCKAMDAIRSAFADTQQARGLQFGPGHFSFNSELGRCPTCEGLGYTTVEMQFMADLSLLCADCQGRRFLPEVLSVTYRDRNIWEVMQLSIDEAIDFFRGESVIIERMKVLREIGLGYLPLGQSLSTLSAGESMRLKLASVLGGTGTKTRKEMLILDEPTTGLHVADIERLIGCFEALLEQGHTIVVIEHNEQLIAAADYCIEMGPGAGPDGGTVVSQGWQR